MLAPDGYAWIPMHSLALASASTSADAGSSQRRLEDSTGGPGTSIAEPRSPRHRGAAVLSSGGIGAQRRKGHRPALRPRGDPEERRGDESWITLYQIYEEGANFASRLGFKGQSVGSPGNY